MKESFLSESFASLNPSDDGSAVFKVVTLDEGYDLTRGNGRYQLLVFVCVGITMISSMWYLYCIPFFLSFPRVGGCANGRCQTVEEACASLHRFYEDPYQNLITELDLLCEDLMVPLIPSSYPTGFLIGILFLSSAADFLGRLPVLLIGQAGMAMSILVLVFFPSYNTCVVCTGMCGFFSVASFFPSYSLAYGANHSNKVKMCAAFLAVSAAVGELFVVCIMLFQVRWRTMCYTYIGFCTVYAMFPILLDETPRFFYARGQRKFAAKVFKKIAKINGVSITEPLAIRDAGKKSVQGDSCVAKTRLLCQRQTLLRLFLCGITFFTTGFVYYGIAFNIEKFGGDMYLNAIVNAVLEIVADLLAFFFAHKIGLRLSLVSAFSIMSFGMVCEFFSVLGWEMLSYIGLYMSKFGVSAGFTLIYTLAGELFPTAILSTAIGILGLLDRFGAMISPMAMRVKELFCLVALSTGIASVIIAFFSTRKLLGSKETKLNNVV